ncbi:hypothetical protein HK097_010796 [Rhizophlyctis rosea]|uniref:SAM domain-containing protein n=1 Tax=Rhizophlyctis rosea TaxID=64517 RepID=A0AAD5WZK1_9FUNG|nr:hypothetical protein HK097_010796 [Rhizophlyctis rosea]
MDDPPFTTLHLSLAKTMSKLPKYDLNTPIHPLPEPISVPTPIAVYVNTPQNYPGFYPPHTHHPFDIKSEGSYFTHFFFGFSVACLGGPFIFLCMSYRPRRLAKNLYHASAFCFGAGVQYVCASLLGFGLISIFTQRQAGRVYFHQETVVTLGVVGVLWCLFSVGAFWRARRYRKEFKMVMAVEQQNAGAGHRGSVVSGGGSGVALNLGGAGMGGRYSIASARGATPVPRNYEVESWDKEQVGEWLDSHELGDVRELFNRHSVDGLAMMHFGQQDLERMGVSMGKAMRFVVARSQL